MTLGYDQPCSDGPKCQANAALDLQAGEQGFAVAINGARTNAHLIRNLNVG